MDSGGMGMIYGWEGKGGVGGKGDVGLMRIGRD